MPVSVFIQNRVLIYLLGFLLGLGIIMMTAVDSGIAALGYVMTVFGFGAMSKFMIKTVLITIPPGIILIVIGYGYLL